MSLNPDECEFKQEDLCSSDHPCQFRDSGWECNATEADVMTEAEYEALQKLSAGLQRIFANATRSLQVEQKKEVSHQKSPNLKSTNITQHNITSTVLLAKKERKKEREFDTQPGGQ